MTEDNIKKIFSRNLSSCLYEKNMTQAFLSSKMDVSTATVSDWCNGKKIPRLDKIQSICNILDVEKSDLLEEKTSEDSDVDEFVKLFKNAKPDVRNAVILALGGKPRNP